jgi:hypothetical protein
MAGAPRYRVEQNRSVLNYLKNLSKRAVASGQSRELANALPDLIERLQNDPHSLGEPRRKTIKPGGMVHFAIHLNFAIHFAILEHEKIVIIFGFQTYGAYWK